LREMGSSHNCHRSRRKKKQKKNGGEERRELKARGEGYLEMGEKRKEKNASSRSQGRLIYTLDLKRIVRAQKRILGARKHGVLNGPKTTP